jgi:hypothetical protein
MSVLERTWSCESRQALSRPRPSLSCQLSCCAARQRRKPRQAPPTRSPASPSKRRSRWQSQIVRSKWQTQGHLAGDRQPLKRHLQPLERHRQVQYWGGLPSWRKSPAIATVVANPASGTAMPLGSGVASRRVDKHMETSRQRAETTSPTNLTRIASRPKCSWAITEIEPTGFVAACPPPGSFKSPNSSDQDISTS